MPSNLDRYKKDLDALILRGEQLSNVIQSECYPEQFKKALKELKQEARDVLAKLPSFADSYQAR